MKSEKTNLPCIALVFTSILFSFLSVKAQTYQWAKGIGGPYWDLGYSTATDAAGNVYTAGTFENTVDFDPGPATYNLTASGNIDMFILKLDSAGNFIWVKRMGGPGETATRSIKLDNNGNIYTTGYFTDSTDLDPGPGTHYLVSTGAINTYISKLDPNGNFVWAKRLSANSKDSTGGKTVQSSSVTTDNIGNVYTTGYFNDTADFDPGPATYNLVAPILKYNVFISKLDAGGNFVWAKKVGGGGSDRGFSITTDAMGNVYTTGYFSDTTADFDPGPGTFILYGPLGANAQFICKLDAGGNFVWAKGFPWAYGLGITADAAGYVYSTGNFRGLTDFDPGPGIYNISSVGYVDFFVSKLDSNGNFIWAKSVGGSHNPSLGDGGSSVITDADGNVYTTGIFADTADFDPGPAIHNVFSNGNTDIFILKLDAGGNFVWVKAMGSSNNQGDNGLSIALDANKNIYSTGNFTGTVDFNPPASANITSVGNDDIFIAKYSQPGGCIAHFSLYADTIPHNWIALNQSSGVFPISYTWSWGDGSSSTGAAPSHIYNIPGYYDICLNITDGAGCVTTYCDSSTYIFKGTSDNTIITINGVFTNIKSQNDGKSKIIIFPNPSDGNFTVHFAEQTTLAEITITNVFGKQVSKEEFKDIKDVVINIEGESGMYFVKVKSNTETGTIKIVKQ